MDTSPIDPRLWSLVGYRVRRILSQSPDDATATVLLNEYVRSLTTAVLDSGDAIAVRLLRKMLLSFVEEVPDPAQVESLLTENIAGIVEVVARQSGADVVAVPDDEESDDE